jgi:DNA-binding transcriptional regulator YhcF (GntR family)
VIDLDATSATPPFEQIRSQLADGIRSGGLEDGRRLPSIRQLAGDLRVAAGTVAKAYALLEEEGLVETSRAHGTRVRSGQVYPDVVRNAARTFVVAAGDLTLEQALGAVRAAWSAR